MKRIGIEINGVLRDTIGKFTQLYEKHMIEESQPEGRTFEIDMSGNTEELLTTEEFEYKILSDVTSLNLMDHFKFNDENELYSFTYEDLQCKYLDMLGQQRHSRLANLTRYI